MIIYSRKWTKIKEDWKQEIEAKSFDINFLEKYTWAYDVSKAYWLNRIKDYTNILQASIMIKENKFDLAINFTKLISDNYLQEFYDFLDPNKSGRIWNGTIEV